MRRNDKIAFERYQKKLELARKGANVNPHETKAEKEARIERAIKDPEFLVEYYFPHYATAKSADFHVEFANRVHRNKHYTGFAKWGRGQAKSVWNNIIIPFREWLTEYQKGNQYYFVLVGQNETRAKQLLEDLRAEFEVNPQIIADFGDQKQLGSWEDGFWKTKTGFIGQAIGLGQSCRGLRVGNLRPNHINCDDLETKKTIKNERIQWEYVEWVEQELLGCMDGEIERLIFSNNWFAPLMFLRKLAETHPDWDIHEVKAYDPVTLEARWKDKYPDGYFARKVERMGSLAAMAEYNNEPHVRGKIFKQEDIQWDKLPRIDHFDAVVAHWDVAYAGTSTADYNAVRVWGLKGRNFYYIDSYVKQSKMRQALEWLADFIESHKDKNVEIRRQYEAQFWNDEVQRTIEEVEDEKGVELLLVKIDGPKTRKYDRIVSLQPYYQNGRPYYNEKKKGHNSTQVGIAQLCGIEPGYNGHDDAPDADEQCIKYLNQFTSGRQTDPLIGDSEGFPDVW